MIEYEEAEKIAYEYGLEIGCNRGISAAVECYKSWYFNLSDPRAVNCVYIRITKESGKIKMLDFFSDEEYKDLHDASDCRILKEHKMSI